MGRANRQGIGTQLLQGAGDITANPSAAELILGNQIFFHCTQTGAQRRAGGTAESCSPQASHRQQGSIRRCTSLPENTDVEPLRPISVLPALQLWDGGCTAWLLGTLHPELLPTSPEPPWAPWAVGTVWHEHPLQHPQC